MAKSGEKFYIDARGVKAEGVVTENGFMVFAGSEVRNYQASYLAKGVVALRQQCLLDGTIVNWKLTRNMEFNSPSSAACGRFRSP